MDRPLVLYCTAKVFKGIIPAPPVELKPNSLFIFSSLLTLSSFARAHFPVGIPSDGCDPPSYCDSSPDEVFSGSLRVVIPFGVSSLPYRVVFPG